jgi:hypothetical protein
MSFPRKYGPAEIPPSVKRLIADVLPQLLVGPHPALGALREQLRGARVMEVEMTGVGFYTDISVFPNAPLAEPPRFAGGHADIQLSGARHGAGCLVFVRDDRLAVFEEYTYDDTWAVDAQVEGFGGVVPVQP